MGLTTALAGLAAVAGIGGLAASGPTLAFPASTAVSSSSSAAAPSTSSGGAGTPSSTSRAPSATAPSSTTSPPKILAASSPSGTTATAPPSTTAGDSSAATPAGAATTTSTAPRCDDGDWRGPGGINVDGRPDGLDAGDRGTVYVWHDPAGWHLRTTDVTNTAHHYTGTIALDGARFTSIATVRLERDDRISVDGNNTLHYAFTTYSGIDGVDFTVSACDGARQHEVLRFTMDINGHEDDPSRIALGDTKQHPDSATFAVTRSV